MKTPNQAGGEGGSSASLERTQAGLLVFNEASHGSHPWDDDDWTLVGLTSKSVAGNGNLEFTRGPQAGSDWEIMYEAGGRDDPEWFFQYTLMLTANLGRWMGFGVGNTSNETMCFGIEVGLDETLFLLRDRSGTQTVIGSSSPNDGKTLDAAYVASFHMTDGGSGTRHLYAYDFNSDTAIQNEAGFDAITGEEKPALVIPMDSATTTAQAVRRYGAASPNVTFASLGAASGYTCQICQADDTVLVEDDESGSGSVVLSMMEANISLAKKVRVLDGETVLATLTPTNEDTFGIDGVFPGETYTFSES